MIPQFSVDELCSFLEAEGSRANPSQTAVFGEQQLEEMVTVIGDAVEVKALQSHVKEEMKPIANWVS